MSNDLNVLKVSANLGDKALNELLGLANAKCLKHRAAFWLVIEGFDEDPRELWDIPEAIDLIDRLVAFGFMTVLGVSVDDFKLLGAYQIWVIHNRLMQGNAMPFTKELFTQFTSDLIKSNNLVDAKFAE
jgi:hypothetical protein